MDMLRHWVQALDRALPLGERWREHIQAYCERGPSIAFWAEPLNAWSNLAFHLAALIAFSLWALGPKARRRTVDLALIMLVAVIGTGSFLFHTLANRWSSVADVAPIGIFMIAYLAYALKRWVGLGWLLTGVALAVFVTTLKLAGEARCGGGACLNGSVGYLPAFAALVLIGGTLAAHRHPAGKYLVAAGLTFAASLVFRTLDRAVCPYTILVASRPWGTHFIWHLLNATLLGTLLIAAVRHGGHRVGQPDRTR